MKTPTANARTLCRSLFKLAVADLLHEGMLSLCTCVALMAVVTPLLLLFGIKEGTMNRLRTRLVQDPRNREIRPLISLPLEDDWFRQIRLHSAVGFVIPSTRGLSASGTILLRRSGASTDVDFVPTASGDPLITENHFRVPLDRECVLTCSAAERVRATVGDEVTLIASRIRQGEVETAETTVRLVGILPMHASGLDAAFLPLALLEAIEDFKDHREVAWLSWPGQRVVATPRYDGLLLFADHTLPPGRQSELASTSRLKMSTIPDNNALLANAGFTCGTNWHAYLLEEVDGCFDQARLEVLEELVGGPGLWVSPWVRPRDFGFLDASGRPAGRVRLAGLPETWPTELGLRRGDLPADAGSHPEGKGFLVWLPPRGTERLPDRGFLEANSGRSSVKVPVRLQALRGSQSSLGLTSLSLLALLRFADLKSVGFDALASDFPILREAHSGFRLYAKSIKDVGALKLHFEQQNIPVWTEAQRIDEVLMLDRNLGFVFWLVSGVGLLGLSAFLAASFLSVVERKRRSLSVLRLLGIRSGWLALFPIFQSVLVMIMVGVSALGIVALVVLVIESSILPSLGLDGHIFLLRARDAVLFFALVGALAMGAALIASVRIRNADLSQGLRYE